jgi:hypothetical protein
MYRAIQSAQDNGASVLLKQDQLTEIALEGMRLKLGDHLRGLYELMEQGQDVHIADLVAESETAEREVRGTIERYVATFHTDAQRYRVLAVEQSFATPMLADDGRATPRVMYRGVFDLVVADMAAGDVVLVEHKCLHGASRVFDHSTGRYWTMEDLCREGHAPQVSAIDAGGRIVVAAACVPVAQPKRPTIRVQTKEGRVLVASDNHPFLTARGWVLASELSFDDWIATPRHMPSAHPGSPLPNEAFRLAGYMIGDGSFSNMSFCKNDERVLADVLACGQAIGEPPKRQPSSAHARATTLRFSRVGPAARLLETMGIAGNAADKRIPQIPMSDAQCGQLLAGLWSTDGCVDTMNGGKPRAIYTSVSKRLCCDIQELLQRLGIASSFNESSVSYRGERRPVFTVKVVSRASKRRFAALIKEGVMPVVRTAVPVDDFVSAISVSQNHSDAAYQPKLDDHVWWDRVISLQRDEDAVLYDIEVPGPHTFVADGLLTHNTSAADARKAETRLDMDPQTTGYVWSLQQMVRRVGADRPTWLNGVTADATVGRVFYNVLRKTGPREPKWTKDGTLSAAACDTTRAVYEAALRVQETEGGPREDGKPRTPKLRSDKHVELLNALPEDAGKWLKRHETWHSKEEQERWRREVVAEGGQLRKAIAGKLPVIRNPGHCNMPWSLPCAYRAICRHDSAAVREADFKVVRDPHVEIVESEEEQGGAL